MESKKLSAREVAQDIRSGMDDEALMAKYQISSQQLQVLFGKLVQAKAVTQQELDQRNKPKQAPVEPEQPVKTAAQTSLDAGIGMAKSAFGAWKGMVKKSAEMVAEAVITPPETQPGAEPKTSLDVGIEKAKGFFGSLGDKVKNKADKMAASTVCSICSTKLTVWESGTKTGNCAKCLLKQGGLLADPDESIQFFQRASYREGLPDYPQEAKQEGFLYVCQDHLCFWDRDMTWKVAWEQVKVIQLENFKMSGTRAVLAGQTAFMLQNVKNYLAVSYFDEQQLDWNVKFQIHGALSIPGEQEKAVEFLGYTNRFKPRFWREHKKAVAETSIPVEDIPAKIGKLAKLKEQGLITQEEFEEKKKELLARL